MASQRMSEAVKKRLREIVAEKKANGINLPLTGINSAFLLSAVDTMANGDINFPVPEIFRAAGKTSYVNTAAFEWRWTFSQEAKRADRRNRTGLERRITHASLLYARDDQHTDIFSAFGGIPIIERVFTGPGRPRELRGLMVYPVVKVLTLIFALWPGENWQDRVKKYVHGYTANAIVNLSPLRYPNEPVLKWPENFWVTVRDGVHQNTCNQFAKSGLLIRRDEEVFRNE